MGREDFYKATAIGDERRLTDSLARSLMRDIYGTDYQFLKEEALKRISEVNEFYQYYNLGDESQGTGQYWNVTGLDYEPTIMPVNLARWFVRKRTAWLFENAPDIECPPESIDRPEKMESVDYKPSGKQKRANDNASGRERILYGSWKANSFEERIMEGARDYLIGGTCALKLRYIPYRGILYQFAPAQEIFPIPDEENPDDFSAIHFASFLDNTKTVWRQTWRLAGNPPDQRCYLTEATYDLQLNPIEVKHNEVDTGLDFIPVLIFPHEKLTGETFGTSYLKDLIPLLDQYNRSMSDSADALRFNLFAINVLLNAAPDAHKNLKFSPGEVWNISGDDVKAEKLESGFNYATALDNFLKRLENMMHLLAEVPDITPEHIKGFGLVSGVALKLLYSDLVSATMRDWRVWKSRLAKANEYTLRMIETYAGSKGAVYDASSIDGNYENRIICHLPLPENEAEKVAIEAQKMANSLQSVKGAMQELGEKYPLRKIAEIIAERERFLDSDTFGKQLNKKEREQLSGA